MAVAGFAVIGPSLRSRHDVIHRQISEREMNPASVAVSLLLAVHYDVTVRSVGRGLALVGRVWDVCPVDDEFRRPGGREGNRSSLTTAPEGT